MKPTVDHRARKQEIIANAIRLFAKLGYRDVSFREISEACGVARTVIYRYFRNKRQIFDGAVILVLGRTRRSSTRSCPPPCASGRSARS